MVRVEKQKQAARGFTLIELLISVAIIGVLAAVAVPTYTGYIENARGTVVKDNLRAIYLQQKEYLTDNNVYFSTGATCTDNAANINATLFNGETVLTNDLFNYCILQTTTTDFIAHAQLQSDPTVEFTINNLNAINW